MLRQPRRQRVLGVGERQRRCACRVCEMEQNGERVATREKSMWRRLRKCTRLRVRKLIKIFHISWSKYGRPSQQIFKKIRVEMQAMKTYKKGNKFPNMWAALCIPDAAACRVLHGLSRLSARRRHQHRTAQLDRRFGRRRRIVANAATAAIGDEGVVNSGGPVEDRAVRVVVAAVV